MSILGLLLLVLFIWFLIKGAWLLAVILLIVLIFAGGVYSRSGRL